MSKSCRRREVVRRARGVRHARADARQAEGADALAQVAPAEQVPFTGDELQAVGVDGARHRLVAADGVVLELDGLAVGDGRLQLGQGREGLVLVLLGEDGQGRRRGLAHQLGPPLRQAEQRQAQRLRVGEAVLEHGEAGGQGGELVVVELDGRQVVGAGGQAVELAAGLLVGFGGDLDAQRRQLGPVLVEAPFEGLVGHQRVALDLLADLAHAGRLAVARQQQRDQREAPHQLVGVLAEAFLTDLGHAADPPGARSRSRRAGDPPGRVGRV